MAAPDKIHELNFDENLMQIYSAREPYSSFEKSLFIRKTPRGGRVLDVELDKLAFVFDIDTGSNCFLSLRDDLFLRLVGAGRVKPTGSGSRLSGKFHKGKILGISLGGVEIHGGTDHESVGLGFLRRFNLAIDFPNSRLHFTVREGSKGTLNVEAMLGVALIYKQNGIFVRPIRDHSNSPLVLLGLLEGDRLIQNGNLSESEISSISLHEVCEKNADAEIKILVKRNGKTFLDGAVRLPPPIYHW